LLFDPTLYAAFFPLGEAQLLDRVFGKAKDRRDVCYYSFEATPGDAHALAAEEHALRRQGDNVSYLPGTSFTAGWLAQRGEEVSVLPGTR